MIRFKSPMLCSAILTLLMTNPAFSNVQIRQDAMHQTIGISGLSAYQAECGLMKFVGRVAKRMFADDALTITGFIIEHIDGTRTFINVDIPDSQDRFTRGAVFDGLQRLLREGRGVIGRVQVCGSGPVLTLEQIQ